MFVEVVEVDGTVLPWASCILRFEDNLTDDADDIHKALKIHGRFFQMFATIFFQDWNVWLVVFSGSYCKKFCLADMADGNGLEMV